MNGSHAGGTPPTNPNFATAPAVSTPRDMFCVDKIESWQKDRWDEYTASVLLTDSQDEIQRKQAIYRDEVQPERIQEYLLGAGVSPLDSHYDNYRSLMDIGSIMPGNPLGDAQWRYDDTLLGAKVPTARERYIQQFSDIFEHERQEEIREQSRAMRESEKLACGAFAARMRCAVWRPKRRKELDKILEEAHEEYRLSTVAYDEGVVRRAREDGVSEDDITANMVARLQARHKRHATNQQEALVGSTLYGRMMNRLGNMDTKKKIAVGVGTAAVIGAAGAVLLPLAGASVAAGAGTAGLGAVRGARTYFMQRSRLYTEGSSQWQSDNAMTLDEVRQSAYEHQTTALHDRIKEGEKVKKIALGATAVSAALIGGGILTHTSDIGDHVGGWFKGMIPDTPPAPSTDAIVPVPSSPSVGSVAPTPTAPLAPLPVYPGTSGAAPNVFDMTHLTDALRIDPGEGWYQTFAESGVKDQFIQQRLLQDPDLMNGLVRQGYAYRDASLGGYGIRMTPDGRMPHEVVQAIRGVAVKKYGALLSV